MSAAPTVADTGTPLSVIIVEPIYLQFDPELFVQLSVVLIADERCISKRCINIRNLTS